MPKNPIRNSLLARRQALAAEICLPWSRRIQQNFLRLPEFTEARILALYSPFRNEVATEEIFQAAREAGKKIAFPRVSDHELEFVVTEDLRELEAGSFGIPEPRGRNTVPIGLLDLLAIPGVAFDLEGFRLGYGKGFYDRMLHDPRERGVLVGLCYEMQIVDSLPAAMHDVRMNLVVTESRMLRWSPLPPSGHPNGGGPRP